MTTSVAPAPDVMNFGEPPKQIQFAVGDDLFECPSSLPILTLIDVAESADSIENTRIADMRPLFKRLFGMLLVPESAQRFMTRMGDRTCRQCGFTDAKFDMISCPECDTPLAPPPADPIGIGVVNRVIPWVMEQYGLRPTEPSGDSSDGQPSPPSGPNSTENAQLAASTFEPSPSIVS
jgi:hypothetical protein